ncbi:MAG TPA: methylated-DNA--[protein]-cysteine S-methyltransferase [Candidatus Angelobacter sp.]|jgi:methylated-DNA-[protein]-cysteine S-methyltransferase|nr:methylated-DNA--[protein]-cysteine S-methyltransferase [Candidatus Angelobacter sp.]
MLSLNFSRIGSVVGPLLVGVSDAGLAVLAFGHELPLRLHGDRVEWRESREATTDVRRQLDEYFAGRRRDFTMPLDLRGTDFQRRCWDELLRIPYGETCSYGEIARAVGSPNAYRAVGQANHHNPVAIIVPCHRVLAGGRELGGYGGGLPRKAFLLRLEGAQFHDAPAAAHPQAVLGLT